MTLPSHSTLTGDIAKARKSGYTSEFLFNGSHLIEQSTGKTYDARQCRLAGYSRHEGMTDPGDAFIFFLIETFDGRKGYLSSPYGVYADERLMNFMLALPFNRVRAVS